MVIKLKKLEESACGGQRTKLPLPLGLNVQGLNANERKDLGRVHGVQLPSSNKSLQREESKQRLAPKGEGTLTLYLPAHTWM